MENRIIVIKEKEFILSARKTRDVLALGEVSDESKKSPTSGMIIMAQIVNDSLKATYINKSNGLSNLPFSKKIKTLFDMRKYRIFVTSGINIIIENLDGASLSKACEKVLELEGVKKKLKSGDGKAIGRNVAKGMIALHFGIPINKVEDLSIVDYRLMLFAAFNNAVLYSMNPSEFKFVDDIEEQSALEKEHRKLFPEKYSEVNSEV